MDLRRGAAWLGERGGVHGVGDYARHCGHADLVRERIDGATGV
ncbi:mycothiol transferase [Blastococcus sp. SYSU D00813]